MELLRVRMRNVSIFGTKGYFLALRHAVGNIPFWGKHLGIINGIPLHPVKNFPPIKQLLATHSHVLIV
jgi:hypothetical protein